MNYFDFASFWLFDLSQRGIYQSLVTPVVDWMTPRTARGSNNIPSHFPFKNKCSGQVNLKSTFTVTTVNSSLLQLQITSPVCLASFLQRELHSITVSSKGSKRPCFQTSEHKWEIVIQSRVSLIRESSISRAVTHPQCLFYFWHQWSGGGGSSGQQSLHRQTPL